MNILVTGAKGFVGRNLVENLKNIQGGKNRTTGLTIEKILEYDLDTDPALLPEYCAQGLLQAVDTAVTMVAEGDNGIPVPDYVEENVSSKVVKIIQSYTGVVNKMVWRKS